MLGVARKEFNAVPVVLISIGTCGASKFTWKIRYLKIVYLIG